MAHIEFLEPAAESADEPAAARALTSRPRRPHWRSGRVGDAVIAVLWLAAAVLSGLAAYRTLYSIDYGSGATGFGYAVDAWGKYAGAGAGTGLPAQRGARYALVLCGCAAAFALLALAAAAHVLRRQPAQTARTAHLGLATTAVGLAAGGVLGGTLAAMYLQADSVLSGVRARVRFSAGFGDPVRGDVHTALGPSPAFALAGLICAALAVAASLAMPPERSVASAAG